MHNDGTLTTSFVHDHPPAHKQRYPLYFVRHARKNSIREPSHSFAALKTLGVCHYRTVSQTYFICRRAEFFEIRSDILVATAQVDLCLRSENRNWDEKAVQKDSIVLVPPKRGLVIVKKSSSN